MGIEAANHAEAPAVGSNLSGNTSTVTSPSSSLHGTGGRRENITRIDRKLYEAAVKGNFDDFADVQNIENLLTPNKNIVLHIHLTSQTTENVSQQFVELILDKCEGLLLLPNAKGETPLHMAARYGHSGIAKLLIERARAFPEDIENGVGAEKMLIRATNRENDTALHEAVRYHHIEVVDMLLETDRDHSYSANNANETPLYLASERQFKHMVSKMLRVLRSPAYDGPSGRTALHAAVINRDAEMARNFLEYEHLRAAVKHADKKGWVPLHYAVKLGDKHLTKLLLEQDENTAYMQDNEGRTALHISAYCNHWIIMKMIIEYYPDCSELVDNNGWNALHYAVNGQAFSAVARISKNLALSNLYNEKDVDGNTPLHHLALSNSWTNHPRLVSHCRVDRMAMNKKDQTALDVAYASVEDSKRRLAIQDLIVQLKKAGARRSQLLDLKSKDGKEKNRRLMFTEKAKETHVIVATLIATVSFAAGLTLPGSTIQDGEHKGHPILGQRASFNVFIVSNTLALVSSASAAFIHLFSPLDKAKWKDYYLSQTAFSFTLVAVATMMVAFATGTYAVLGSSSIGIAVLAIGLLFFLVLRQVLQISFGVNSIIAFIENVANVIIFPFLRFGHRPCGLFFFQFLRDQYERRNIFEYFLDLCNAAKYYCTRAIVYVLFCCFVLY